MVLSDAAQSLSADAGCDAGPPLTCVAFDQDIRFGSGGDTFRSFSPFAIALKGAGGDDSIRAAGSFDEVDAGSGADRVWENGNSAGFVNGGSGDDKLYSFGAETPVDGGNGDDLVITAAGGPDGVSLAGGYGDDELVARYGHGTANGGPDDDVISLVDELSGWTAIGDGGHDVIAGGSGSDTVSGGGGNDVIDVSGDDEVDHVDCGSGNDTVIYDVGDSISRNCESRRVGPRGTLPQITRARSDAAAFVAAMPPVSF
jgi:Ca2+-binding RTX toxin-like protein